MMLRVRAKVLLHAWSYDFYDTTLSTEKQRCHIIKFVNSMFKYVSEVTAYQYVIFLRRN